MTSKQRVLTAIDHKQPDRTPLTFDAEKEVYELLYNHFNINSKEALFDKLNIDTWMVLPRGFEPEPMAETNDKKSIWGYKTAVAKYTGGTYDEIVYNPLAGKDRIDDIKNWKAPDAGQLDFSHFPIEIENHKDKAIIGVFTWGAYFIASYVRGMENLFMDFALQKDYAHYLIDKIAESCFVFLDQMLTVYGDGIDIVYMADDYCSQMGPLFSPQSFEEFVVPYLTKFVTKTHEHGKKFLLHCCGAVRPLLPMIIDAGVDMLEPIQIRANGMDPAGLKKDFGKDLCFYGGVDLQETLCESTAPQVCDEVKRLIDILGKNGGYILGPGHTYIQIDAPVENILAMYETAKNDVLL